MIFYFCVAIEVTLFSCAKKICLAGLLLASVALADGAASPEGVGSGCVDGAPVAAVRFDGLKHTKARVVERELQHKVGSKYSEKVFESEKLRLQDLDLFTEVSVTCENAPQGSVNLVYHFQEIFRWIPAPDPVTTDQGLLIGLALANLNVAGEDIRAEVHYRTAVDPFFENNEYALYASSPYLFGLPLGWNFEFLHKDRWDDLGNFKDFSFLFDLDLDYSLERYLSLLFSGAFRYLDYDGGRKLPELGIGFAFDFRDSKQDARNGVYYEYMLTHVGGEGESYWEILNDARGYFSIGRFVTGATGLFRYRPGDVERYDYFYHGGTNTFRGLGEADSLHRGVHEALLTLEERFVLIDRRAVSLWGINLFYGIQLVAGLDGSLLWDDGMPSWDNYEWAAYGGVHFIIPALDRVRLEVGYSPDNGEPVWTFGLGAKASCARWRSR